jgi:hypothetical protein
VAGAVSVIFRRDSSVTKAGRQVPVRFGQNSTVNKRREWKRFGQDFEVEKVDENEVADVR